MNNNIWWCNKNVVYVILDGDEMKPGKKKIMEKYRNLKHKQ